MKLENGEIGFILIGFFIIINILIMLFFIISYRNIIPPVPMINNTKSQNMTCESVAHRYLLKKQISDLSVVSKPHQTLITNCYRKKTFYINDLQLFNQTYFLSGMALDYVLGRTFFAAQLHLKNKHIRTMNFFLYLAPRILLLLFVLFAIINIIFYVLIKFNSNLLDNSVIFFLERFGIWNLLLIFIIAGYLVLLGFNSHFKQNLENWYESEMQQFVKTEFQELYDDWIIARRYARSNQFTYLFGYNFVFKRIYKYTGPFGL